MLISDGSIQVAWVSDGRVWPNGAMKDHGICSAALPAMEAAAPGELVAYQPPAQDGPALASDEAADVARIRAYRTKTAAGELRIARGDMHRHTDISWDGNRDGSLFDSYRYALDAVAFDYVGVTDHQAGQSRFLTIGGGSRKLWICLRDCGANSCALYSYERSLPYPNGHRNVIFTKRGNPISWRSRLPSRKGRREPENCTPTFRKLGGIAMAHTSATDMGTDWRDNDPMVEPAVEIYQGYRANYEGPNSPRAGRRTNRADFRWAMCRTPGRKATG